MSNPFINSQQIFQRAVLTIYRMSKEPILKTKTIKETGNQMPYNASTQFKEAFIKQKPPRNIFFFNLIIKEFSLGKGHFRALCLANKPYCLTGEFGF